jgi:hypothetical protein
MLRVKLRGFGGHVSSPKTRWNDSEIIKNRKGFLMQMFQREKSWIIQEYTIHDAKLSSIFYE